MTRALAGFLGDFASAKGTSSLARLSRLEVSRIDRNWKQCLEEQCYKLESEALGQTEDADMGTINVFAELTAVGVDVPSGSTQYWQTSGLGYGRGVWYVAWPLTLEGFPGTNEFEVTHVSCEAPANGDHLVNLAVTSKGTNPYGSYGLFIMYTDPIP